MGGSARGDKDHEENRNPPEENVLSLADNLQQHEWNGEISESDGKIGENLQPEHAAELGVRAVAKDELFATADIVTLHLKLSDRTRGIVGADELAAMRRSAYLINTSRGPLIDEDALIEALRTDSIAGAGLDVFDVEPLPAQHPLRTLPNTVVTPHLGYVTTGTYERWWPQVVENIKSWADGQAVRVL